MSPRPAPGPRARGELEQREDASFNGRSRPEDGERGAGNRRRAAAGRREREANARAGASDGRARAGKEVRGRANRRCIAGMKDDVAGERRNGAVRRKYDAENRKGGAAKGDELAGTGPRAAASRRAHPGFHLRADAIRQIPPGDGRILPGLGCVVSKFAPDAADSGHGAVDFARRPGARRDGHRGRGLRPPGERCGATGEEAGSDRRSPPARCAFSGRRRRSWRAAAGMSGGAGAIRRGVERRCERAKMKSVRSWTIRSARWRDPARVAGTRRADRQRRAADMGKRSLRWPKPPTVRPVCSSAGAVWNMRQPEARDARPKFPEALSNPGWDPAIPWRGQAISRRELAVP